jgi:antitoxin MazE
MKLAKWGNSLAVRLPSSVVEALDLKDGDDIEIEVVGARQLEVKRTEDNRQVLDRLKKFRNRLPPDFRFDRLDANAR